MEPWLHEVEGGVEVSVWVVPGSSRTEPKGRHGNDLKVRVAAPPERGRANADLVAFLVEATGARRGAVVAGTTGRRKRVRLEGVTAASVLAALGTAR